MKTKGRRSLAESQELTGLGESGRGRCPVLCVGTWCLLILTRANTLRTHRLLILEQAVWAALSRTKVSELTTNKPTSFKQQNSYKQHENERRFADGLGKPPVFASISPKHIIGETVRCMPRPGLCLGEQRDAVALSGRSVLAQRSSTGTWCLLILTRASTLRTHRLLILEHTVCAALSRTKVSELTTNKPTSFKE